MSFFYDYPNNWQAETTHDITTDTPCHDAIEPTISFAEAWGSTAHQHSFTVDNVEHVIVVRKVEA